MDTLTSPVSVSRLQAHLGRADAPLLIDVRRQAAFETDAQMIAGATWRDPFTVADWAKFLPRHREVVVYCVHGHEVSKNAAAALETHGIKARYLEGGIEQWRAGGGMLCRKAAALNIPSGVNQPTVWVTRERPKIDRIACPWLIRRFIDPLAEFLYVPASSVTSVAGERTAIPYDVPGVQFTHRGDFCSFDALIADFALEDAALGDLASIVRGADTGMPELTPQSPGLLAVSLGLSALYADDHEMLTQGMIVYDALYAWLKSARAEIHNADLFKRP
ncbi:MAG TPA: chromate resistance protein ChrB domain-containing protein [Usitatibacteraceae bacterium]